MNISGNELINSLSERLKDLDELCTDSQILILLRSLDSYDINQLVTFGTVDKWQSERINKISNQ